MAANNKRLLCIALTFALVACCCGVSFGDQEGLCTGDNATIDCLRQHPEELYQADHNRFWDIVVIAEKKATNSKDIKDTIGFLRLVEEPTSIAEHEEYLYEIIPTLCVKKPRLFLDALSASSEETLRRVMTILKAQIDVEVEGSNLYIDNALVSKVLSKYKNEKKYKRIMDMYYAKETP